MVCFLQTNPKIAEPQYFTDKDIEATYWIFIGVMRGLISAFLPVLHFFF